MQMLSPFICGSFHPEEEEEPGTSPSSTPRKSKRNKDSKNPYSARGLDKFEALLADLEGKRREIYTRNDPGDISFVRFAYTSSNDCVPIVVKMKDKGHDHRKTKSSDATNDKHPVQNPGTQDKLPSDDQVVSAAAKGRKDESDKKTEKRNFTWDFMKVENWRKPSYYMPVAIILIMLFLAFFGRSVTILCTSIGWYAVPTRRGRGHLNNAMKPVKKKELGRRLSENKMVIRNVRSSSPKSRNSSPPNQSPEHHGHRTSW